MSVAPGSAAPAAGGSSGQNQGAQQGAVANQGQPNGGTQPGSQSGSQAGAVDPGKSAPDGKQPTEAQVRKLRLKLEGQDVELPESEVIALAQQGRVANKRFQEASAMKKQAEDLAAAMKADPKGTLARLGIDVRKFSEETLVEMLQAEAMSPEQKAAAENSRKLKEYQAREKQAQDEARQKELAEAQKKHHDNYEKLFTEALTSSGLPKTAYTVKRMAELQLVNLRKGLNLDAGSLAKLVKEDYIAEQKQLFGAMDGDALMEALGPELVKRLSKAQIAKLKARSSTGQFAGRAPAREEPAAPEGLSWKELKRRNRMSTT